MKRTTERSPSKARWTSTEVPKATRRLVIGTRGAQVEIAGIAGCSRGYVWDVIHGRKAPSPKLWNSIVEWMQGASKRALREMAEREMGSAGAE